MEPFGARLRVAMDNRGPFCVGIDPHPDLLRAWSLDDDAAGLERFAMTAVEALAGELAVLKPQSAFFERHGSRGIAVLERLVTAARTLGSLVLLDVKRGDIGSTMQGYADAYVDQSSPLAADAVTVSPFLGFASLRPVLDTAAAHGAGVFVLALTSNAGGAQVQRARVAEVESATGESVAGAILSAIRAENAGATPLGSVGAVVAANLETVGEDLAVNGPLLAPGFGAQGGSADDVGRLFSEVYGAVLPTSSREILRAGPSPDALRAAARKARDMVSAAIGR